MLCLKHSRKVKKLHISLPKKYSSFSHSASICWVSAMRVVICVRWVNRKAFKNSSVHNFLFFIHTWRPKTEWWWAEVATSCSSYAVNCQSLCWDGAWGGDDDVIYSVSQLGGTVSNVSFCTSTGSLTNTPSSGVRILSVESENKPNSNWLKPYRELFDLHPPKVEGPKRWALSVAAAELPLTL